MKSRILVSVVGVPLILVVVLWAPIWVMSVFLAALSAIAAWELMRCVDAQEYQLLCAVTTVGAALSVCFTDSMQSINGDVVVLYTLLLLSYAVFRNGKVKFHQVMAALFAVFVVPYAFGAFLRLYAAGLHRGFLLLPLLFSFGSDTFAFFTGRALGRHKLAPKVSPHKTVEGSIGGLVGNALCGLAFAFVMNRFFDCSISYGGIALLGLVCSVAAQLGDLSFSLIKREFGIKDYGHIFLEHGGVLDRFDSVLFVTPVMEILFSFL